MKTEGGNRPPEKPKDKSDRVVRSLSDDAAWTWVGKG
jgi:hypothetical protein